MFLGGRSESLIEAWFAIKFAVQANFFYVENLALLSVLTLVQFLLLKDVLKLNNLRCRSKNFQTFINVLRKLRASFAKITN